MKIKLDENLHVALSSVFVAHGHDIDTVAAEGLSGADDASVLAAACDDERIVVTLDRGFGDVRLYPPGTHRGILVLRLDDQSVPATEAAIEELLTEIELADLDGCVAVWYHGSLRIRRPTVDPER